MIRIMEKDNPFFLLRWRLPSTLTPFPWNIEFINLVEPSSSTITTYLVCPKVPWKSELELVSGTLGPSRLRSIKTGELSD